MADQTEPPIQQSRYFFFLLVEPHPGAGEVVSPIPIDAVLNSLL